MECNYLLHQSTASGNVIIITLRLLLLSAYYKDSAY